MRSLRPRNHGGQLARKLTGLRGESLVRSLLRSDRKLNARFDVHVSRSHGKVPGLDVKLYKKTVECKLDPNKKECLPAEMEVKTIEKLFEYEKSKKQWPQTRESRFVLKPYERPQCYAFVIEDELTHHTVVDIVDSGRVLRWMSHLRKTKRPKLPVRAIPLLRKYPCRYVSRPHIVIPHLHRT